MAYELEIHYEGEAPGIAEHRLSLDAFGAPLFYLLTALRRIATQMVSQAVGEPKVGRFADVARNLDIEITQINGNSLGLQSVITFEQPILQQPELPLWADLPERAGRDLLDYIERESKGQLAHKAVRTYLEQLPRGLSKQEYRLHSNGRVIKNVTISNVQLTELPPDLPYLIGFSGDIVGVGFDPGRNEVRVKPESGNTTNIAASGEDVDRAIAMRHEKVRTLAIHTSKGTRLISLKRASEARAQFDPEDAKKKIFARWDNVLRRLAK